MKPVVACYSAAIALALSGCTSMGTTSSIYVNNGIGSEHGNYGLQPTGETTSPFGERCVVFSEDRPLSKDFALRVLTESCGSASKMECKELSRTIIPISESSLKNE